jgi:hypothetical protein
LAKEKKEEPRKLKVPKTKQKASTGGREDKFLTKLVITFLVIANY